MGLIHLHFISNKPNKENFYKIVILIKEFKKLSFKISQFHQSSINFAYLVRTRYFILKKIKRVIIRAKRIDRFKKSRTLRIRSQRRQKTKKPTISELLTGRKKEKIREKIIDRSRIKRKIIKKEEGGILIKRKIKKNKAKRRKKSL